MTDRHGDRAERLPRGIWSSTAIGVSAAAIGWFVTAAVPAVTSSYTRLDQLTALILGALTGAGVLGARAYRQRRSTGFGITAGALLGGVGALAGASVIVFDHAAITPRWFVVERVMAWLLTAVGTALFLGMHVERKRWRWLRESLLIAAIGGGTAGAMFSLPGASDAWQAMAFAWFGGAIAFAVSGPELWHAFAVIEGAPAKGRGWNPLLMREWPLHDAASLDLGEAQVACQGGRVALYPPAGGLVSNGHSVREPRLLESNALIVIGRARYHIQLLRAP